MIIPDHQAVFVYHSSGDGWGVSLVNPELPLNSLVEINADAIYFYAEWDLKPYKEKEPDEKKELIELIEDVYEETVKLSVEIVEEARERKISPQKLRTSNGDFVMADVLCAQADLLCAIRALKAQA